MLEQRSIKKNTKIQMCLDQILAGEEAATREECSRLEQQHRAERSQLLHQEQARQQTELDRRLEEVRKQRQQLQAAGAGDGAH